MMINDARTRWPLAVMGLHTAFVAATVWAKNGLYGSRTAHSADRLLRLVDAPVLWLVDPALQRFALPAEWLYPNIHFALGVHELLAYGAIGGAFYVFLAWLAAALVHRRRLADGAMKSSETHR